jgi:hypothetical protein
VFHKTQGTSRISKKILTSSLGLCCWELDLELDKFHSSRFQTTVEAWGVFPSILKKSKFGYDNYFDKKYLIL